MSIATYIAALPLPECAMSINGYYPEVVVTGYRTSSVSGRGSFNTELNEQTLGEIGETRYVSKRNPPRDIVVKYNLSADSRADHNLKCSLLKRLLGTPESIFIFADEPENFYVGTISSVSEEIGNTGGNNYISSSGEITIHCSDPSKYSINERSFIVASSTVTVINDGIKAVPIDYIITNHADNSYITMTSSKGILGVGSLEEIVGRYHNGDIIVVDGSAGKTYINSTYSPTEEIKGSIYFWADPGSTVINFDYSSFCTADPTIIVKIREAWA